jgi:SAM-dependent methyltransferase
MLLTLRSHPKIVSYMLSIIKNLASRIKQRIAPEPDIEPEPVEEAPTIFDYRGYQIPIRLIHLTGAGPEHFDNIAQLHWDEVARYAPLRPEYQILEVGCGIGRDAIWLTDFLDAEGAYTGIDIIADSIAWCRENISARFPRFQFIHYDVHDPLHNPEGTIATTDIHIPLADGSLDRILLHSVFTHLFEKEIAHYLGEFRRLLKPDGLVYASFFVVDEETLQSALQSNSTPFNLTFQHSLGDGCYINDPESPAGAVAYTPETIQRLLQQAGLALAQPIHYGYWSGLHPEAMDGQDILILRRSTRP